MSTPNIGAIIAVSSCKGGVGKSTVAVSLAKELASRGFRVGLVDADIYGPSVPTLLNLHQIKLQVNSQKQFIPITQNNLKVMSFGFLLGDAPAILRGPIVTRYIQQLLLNTEWGSLDYLFIDMPPGTGDIQLTITQTVRLSGAIIVTTPHTLSLIDVARGILMFEKVNVPILGVINNMAYFICDECEKKHYLFGQESGSLKDRFGIEVLAEWPLTSNLSSSLIKETLDKTMTVLERVAISRKDIPQIQFDQQNVTLSWPNGTSWLVKNRDLRLSCRCALCADELTGKRLLKEEDVPLNIAAREVTPLGNYAVGIVWNDGHSSGIYPYKNIEPLTKKS